jgi:hypothetical protein
MSLVELYVDLQHLLIERDDLTDKINMVEKEILELERKNYKQETLQQWTNI